MLNWFKYFEIFWPEKLDPKFIHNFLSQNVSIPPYCILPTDTFTTVIKNRFYFFFLIFRHTKLAPSSRMPRYWQLILNLTLFLSALRFSNLIDEAKGLISIIVSGSSPWKLLSRLILLRSILRISILLQENRTLPESSF